MNNARKEEDKCLKLGMLTIAKYVRTYQKTGGIDDAFSWYVCTYRFARKHSVYGNLPLSEYGKGLFLKLYFE